MTINEFIIKWNVRFATNDTFEIDEADLREFKDDVAQFLQAGPGGTPTLSELVLPQPIMGGSLYLTSTGIWEARSSFNASAAPMLGSWWRLVASFRQQVTAASISDASAAGRSLLTAASASVQLGLLDVLDIKAGQYGDHPAFARAYTEAGLLLFMFKKMMQPAVVPVVSGPAAPTSVQVDDTADTLSGILVLGYPAVADYEVFGAPAFPGIVNASTAGADIQNGRIISRGLTGPIMPGSAGIRVAASGSRPAGAWMLNDRAFTGAAVVTPPPATTTYTATQQSYTTTEVDYQAACGKAYEGAFVGITRTNSSETSTNNQAEANAKALAAATQAAKNAITCQVQPVAYDNTVGAGLTVKGVTLGAQPGDSLEFNNASGADNSAVTMELWLANEQVAAVPYENYYTGKPFRYTHNALKYTKNFAAGRIDL